ncbi:hypothetical protein HIM_07056 [Hirsutella minnesotensis 3608]|uniref:F-box domain-containing protein n=1 Tax=Hirsutella minnesotensis 3608 TaxID=1043627 RepID=A0A0F7ZNC3_9HYPO|nr:hypothetical protein HIM_07056 [Hirsutella minnesotensis 3608]
MELPSPDSGMARARLPVELMLHIVDCVLPANPQALIPASHIATKTLLALTRVSRATPAAGRRAGVHASETLRRLVVQIPFGSLDPLDDHLNVRRTLRQGFEQLTRLEEFACIGDYPALSVPDAHTDVWRLWPNLRRLALFGVPLDSHWLWWDIATLPELAHVVLARPQRAAEANIKDEYFHKLPRRDPRLARDIKVLLLDTAYEIADLDTARWKEIDPAGSMTVEVYEVPVPFYADEAPDQLVTAWVKRGALDGTLWTWTGTKAGP